MWPDRVSIPKSLQNKWRKNNEDSGRFARFAIICCIKNSSKIAYLPVKRLTNIAADETLFFYFYLSKQIRLDVSCESSA